MRTSRGSSTVEMVLLAPVLVLLLIFVAALGRTVNVSIGVRSAAENAARSASMVSAGRMDDVGRQRVLNELAKVTGCSRPRASIDIAHHGSYQLVTVTASCDLDRRGIASLFRVGRSFTASSTEVVDVFTYR